MSRVNLSKLWLDLMVTIGIVLSLLVGLVAGNATARWVVIALVVAGLLLELRRWFRDGNARWQ